ncbi:GLE1-like protein-domain-containing protein [Boletus coccyginus]|nr:GLE1-like protein-domain-containing protein [Boletus coccyginus]
MLVVHPASLCDVCLDPYVISSEPANSPHVIACGHIFCLKCLRNLSPSVCPLCRKAFHPGLVNKLHAAGPPELDDAAEKNIEAEAIQLLQRVALVSGEDVPDVEIIEVVTRVKEWLSNNFPLDDSHRPLRAALATLQRYKALQKRNERDNTEYRRVRHELKAYRRNAYQVGITSSEEDWIHARQTLENLKAGPMKTVKGDKVLKPQWNAIRRQITPKIGQLTHDPATIARITDQIFELIHSQHGLPKPPMYMALLSSLAKAILLQAEMEVTMEKKSAIPLARVTANLLERLPAFPDIFFAKLVQRSGGWPVPSVIPSTDAGGIQWQDVARTKAMGYRVNNGEQESMGDYVTRICGMMRVYFLVMVAPVANPLDNMFRLPRYWTYFARMMNDERLLSTAVAAQLLYTALDVGGMEAKHIWGKQWVKLLELLYEAATVGIGGKSDTVLGGQSPEGKAASVRVQLEIENIVRS